MDLSVAASKHMEWRNRFNAAIRNHEQLPPVSTIAADNQCDLGKWLHGEGKPHSNIPAYQRLVALHAEFHRKAAAVATEISNGRMKNAEAMLGADGAFFQASLAVIAAIGALQGSLPGSKG